MLYLDKMYFSESLRDGQMLSGDSVEIIEVQGLSLLITGTKAGLLTISLVKDQNSAKCSSGTHSISVSSQLHG